MIRVFTDFNARSPSGICWNLVYHDRHLSDQISSLGVSIGDKIILYQDEDDFEVLATLDFGYVDMLARDAWFARPEWSTLVRK
jgi:hypothetical protein